MVAKAADADKSGDVTAEATLLRVSGRVAYGEVLMRVAGDLVAHATGTYIVPR
jgi:acyl-coenzyme A thioesterase PaaI-like protein